MWMDFILKRQIVHQSCQKIDDESNKFLVGCKINHNNCASDVVILSVHDIISSFTSGPCPCFNGICCNVKCIEGNILLNPITFNQNQIELILFQPQLAHQLNLQRVAKGKCQLFWYALMQLDFQMMSVKHMALITF